VRSVRGALHSGDIPASSHASIHPQRSGEPKPARTSNVRANEPSDGVCCSTWGTKAVGHGVRRDQHPDAARTVRSRQLQCAAHAPPLCSATTAEASASSAAYTSSTSVHLLHCSKPGADFGLFHLVRDACPTILPFECRSVSGSGLVRAKQPPSGGAVPDLAPQDARSRTTCAFALQCFGSLPLAFMLRMQG
jgi:hypothetical protein